MCSPSLLLSTCSVEPSLVLNVLFFLSCAQCAARLKARLLRYWDEQIFNVHSRAALTQERAFLLCHQTAGKHSRGSGVWRQIMWRRSLHGLHRVCVFLDRTSLLHSHGSAWCFLLFSTPIWPLLLSCLFSITVVLIFYRTLYSKCNMPGGFGNKVSTPEVESRRPTLRCQQCWFLVRPLFWLGENPSLPCLYVAYPLYLYGGKKTERVREREISRFLVSFPLIKAIESD